MPKHPLLSVICILGAMSSSVRIVAQAPVSLKDNPLKGVIDFHVHSGPDSFTRSVTDIEIAQIAKARGLGVNLTDVIFYLG